MYDRLAVVGDVHGDSARLKLMLAALQGRVARIVFVGDYVDRGPDSAGVLDILAATVADQSMAVLLLAGNHEAGLIRYLETGDFVPYAAAGGMATIRSYVQVARGNVHDQLRRSMPREHVALLRSLSTHLETESLLVSHAGFDPKMPMARTPETMVEGRFGALLAGAELPLPRPLVVCGHYIQRSKRPFNRGGFYCLDTGCGSIGGPLTALLLPQREYVTI